ncbi:condensation domain-containing protein [Streptomyces sp. NPDC005438]|uniref:condensation domain-containing protein n=1 Tax=Streptomyces sp. NPDC005438 TaxID=3156880 RepID=UPI0033BE6B02
MRMVQIDEHHPEPGTLVEFRVTARFAAREHAVPPSVFQRSHWALADLNRAAGVRQSPWVALAFDLPGRVDTEALAAAWQDVVFRHEALRGWYEPAPGLDGHRGWMHTPDAIRVSAEPRGGFTDPADLRERLHTAFREETDPYRWPGLWAAVVVRDSVSTCYFAIDHGYSDGHSLAVLFEELTALYRQHLGGPGARPRATHGMLRANQDEARRLAELSPASLRDPLWAPWRDFFRGGESLPGFPADLGNPEGRLLPGVRREYELLDGPGALEFRDYCRAHGGGFAAGLFAALALEQRAVTGQSLYRVLTSVSTRTGPRWLATQGWLINLVPVVFDVSRCVGLGEAVPLAQRAFQRARRLLDYPVHRAVELLAEEGAVAEGQMRIPPMVSYLDGRSTPGSEEYASSRVTLFTGPDNASGVSLWANWFRDRADVVASMPDTPRAADSVPAHLQAVRERMRFALAGPRPVR